MPAFLFKPPLHSTGIYSDPLAKAMTELGVVTWCRTAGSDRIASFIQRRLPTTIASRTLPYSSHPPFFRRFLSELRAGDAAFVYTNRLLTDRRIACPFEKALKKQGAYYVFHLPDAWPLSPEWRPHVDARVRLADCVATVTPELTELMRSQYPGVPCVTCEEGVSTEDFEPDFSIQGDEPVILWSGPPSKIKEVERLAPVLEAVFRRHPFRLRIVSGRSAPRLRTRVPSQWIPFFGTTPAQRFQGSSIAFAQYDDTPYGRCKGNFKIKTYLSAGCAVVSSPVGYNRELIRPGVNGLFASAPEEWEAALLRLLSSPDECLAMRKASRELAVRRFSYKAVAGQYAGVLRRLGVESLAVTK